MGADLYMNPPEEDRPETLVNTLSAANSELRAQLTEMSEKYHELKVNRGNTVLVPSDKLKEMQQRLEILDALEAYGVDNWSGYELALENI